jgi:hypothetical protein
MFYLLLLHPSEFPKLSLFMYCMRILCNFQQLCATVAHGLNYTNFVTRLIDTTSLSKIASPNPSLRYRSMFRKFRMHVNYDRVISLYFLQATLVQGFFLFPVALQSLKDLGHLTYRRFLELFRHMVGLLGRVISPSHGLYIHMTTQHRKTRTNIHALSGIQTHDPSNQPAKANASDRTATVTGRPDIRLKILKTKH